MKKSIKNRLISFFSLFFISISFYLFLVKKIRVGCIFKSYLNIECPSCGMTRAFANIMHFDFAKAFYYNILSIPLAIAIVISVITLIIDLITGKNTFFVKIKHFFTNYYILIILAIIVSFIYNNIVVRY